MLLPSTTRALVHRLAKGQVEGRSPSIAGAVARGGAAVWSHAVEATTDTQYRIGSLTKTFVAVLVMRLRDEGRLRLSDPLEQHLPGTPIGELTIAQLLSHTSGLASETPAPWWERSPGELRPEVADLLGDPPTKHPPGRRFHYSNPGYGTLGALVEELRGRPWGDVVQQEILDPLEMSRTSRLPQPPSARGWAVHPWADVVMPEEVQDVGRMGPAGQLWSTVEDLCRFASLLMNGADGVLSADTVEEMRTPHSAPEAASWDAGYGLGVQTLRVGGRMLAGHTGSMPGFLCTLWVSVDDDAGAAVLANATSGVPVGTVAADLVGIVAEREPHIPPPWKPLPDLDESLLALTGPWYWGPAAFALSLRRDRVLELTLMSGGSRRSSRFRQNADGDWIGANGYYHGERLVPVYDSATGRLSHLDIGSFVFTREPYDRQAPIPGGVDPDGWRGAAPDAPSSPPGKGD